MSCDRNDAELAYLEASSDEESSLEDLQGCTALHIATKHEDLDAIRQLLKNGADVTIKDARGMTPLLRHSIDTHLDELRGPLKDSLVDALLSAHLDYNVIQNPRSEAGISHLHAACITNNVEAVEHFLRNGVSADECIDATSPILPGFTPLHFAARYCSTEVARVLLDHGARPHPKDALRSTPLHALLQRNMEIADWVCLGKRHRCGYLRKEYESNEKMIVAILEKSEEDWIGDMELTRLHVAATLKDTSMLEKLLENEKTNVDQSVKKESWLYPGYTALHFAAHFNLAAVKLLMNHGADISAKSVEKLTPLDVCSRRYEAEIMRDLVDSRAESRDIRLSDGRTRLMDFFGAMRSVEEFHRFVGETLDDVNVFVPHDSPIFPGCTPLHLVTVAPLRTKNIDDVFKNTLYWKPDKSEVYNCDEEESNLYTQRIDVILDRSPDCNITDSHGSTALHLAFGMLSQDAAEKLLRRAKKNFVDRNGLSHLHIACALGQLDAFERYVSEGADVNSRTGLEFIWHDQRENPRRLAANSTPLHVAVLFRRKSIVEYLLASNADAQAADSLGFTPIHLTMAGGRPNVVVQSWLLDAALPNLRDSVCAAGLSHLHVAVYAGHAEAVQRLVLGGADIESRVDEGASRRHPLFRWCSDETPLEAAFQKKCGRAVEILLRAGANIHVKNSYDNTSVLHDATFLYSTYPWSPAYFRALREREPSDEVGLQSDGITWLHVACAARDVEWAESLLDRGADVDARVRGGDDEGATPLHVAVGSIHYEPRKCYDLVKLLVDRGADVTAKSDWTCYTVTPLWLIYNNIFWRNASYQFEHELEDEFLLRTVDLLFTSQKSYRVDPTCGYSHLYLACLRNNVDAATKFLDHGADVNESIYRSSKFYPGFTPLHFAMAYKGSEVAHLLMERGADVNAKDSNGNTPLHVAFESRYVNLPLIEATIRFGADVRAKNVIGNTLLHFLVKVFDDLPTDEYLNIIERTGMDSCLYERDVDGNTPLHAAIEHNNSKAMEALFCMGFNINVVDLESKFGVDVNKPIEEHRVNVAKTLARHIWKIRFHRLDLTTSNLKFLESVEEQFSLLTSLEQVCQDELTKARKTEICEGVTVKDFLSELGAAAAYPTMHPIRRAIIDKYFKCIVDLHHEFPEFCGLLVLHFKKALARTELIQPAKEAIAFLFPVELPDLCLEAVLRLFTNGEMKVLSEVAEELFV